MDKDFFRSLFRSKTFYWVLWNVGLNVILIIAFSCSKEDYEKILFGTALGIEIVFSSVFTYLDRRDSNLKAENELKKHIEKAIEGALKESISIKLDKELEKFLNEFLERLKKENQNVVFLRTLSDAICNNGNWDTQKLKNLLKAIDAVATENKKRYWCKILRC